MPEPAAKPALTQEELETRRAAGETVYLLPAEFRDRSEGWGITGRAKDDPERRDDGEWPSTPPKSPFSKWPTETSDGDWYSAGEKI